MPRPPTSWWSPTRRAPRDLREDVLGAAHTANIAGPAWCCGSLAPAGGRRRADRRQAHRGLPAAPGADQVSHAMTPRAAGRRAAYEALLRVRGATFLTPAT